MSYVKQGKTWQLIALGDSTHAGEEPTKFHWDGAQLWAGGKVVQPQSGFKQMNGIYASLGRMNGDVYQKWRMLFTGQYGNKHKAGNKAPIKENQGGSSGFAYKGYAFEIRAYVGGRHNKVVYIDQKDGMKLKIRDRKNNNEERFFFDKISRTLHWMNDDKISVAAVKKNGKYQLIGRKTEGTTPEWFAMPARNGVIELTADKNFLWRVQGSSNANGTPISIEQSNGDRNWRQNGNYFSVVYRGPSNITPKSFLT